MGLGKEGKASLNGGHSPTAPLASCLQDVSILVQTGVGLPGCQKPWKIVQGGFWQTELENRAAVAHAA